MEAINKQMAGRPKLPNGITRGRALSIRRFFEVSDKQLGEQAKKLGITRNQLYEIKNQDYLKARENKKWQTKNKNKRGKPINEVDFLKQIVDAPEPIRLTEGRLGLDEKKKYFVTVSFTTKTRFNGFNQIYYDILPRTYTIDCMRSELRNAVISYLERDYNEVDSGRITELDLTKPITINIQRAERFNVPVNIRNIPMRRCGVLKYKFMPEIANISFNTTEMKCVIQCLYHRYKNNKRKIFTEKSITEDFKRMYEILYLDEDLEECPEIFDITPAMVLEWCKKHKITCYMFDIKNKLFEKYVSPSRNLPPLVFYAVDEHMYLIENPKVIDRISKKYADTTHHKTQIGADENEVEDLSKLPIYDYDDIMLVCNKTPIYQFADYLELIQAPSVVMVNKSNLFDIFIELFKSGQVPNTKHKGEQNIKEIEYIRKDEQVVKIMRDATYGTKNASYRDVMKICKQINIPFTNQGIGTLTRSYYDYFRGRKSVRIELDRPTFFSKNCKCVKCGSTEKLQIDHIIPLASGGTNDEDNLQALCKLCHFEKTKEEREDNTYINIDPISSSFNDKVNEIFQSDLMKKWAFVENMGKYTPKKAYDINKCRKNIMYHSKYEWAVYSVMDDVCNFDGEVKCGFYYVETTSYFPMRGNGWYSQPMIEYCLANKIIEKSNIKYQLLPSMKLNSDYFNEFIDSVYAKFGNLNKNAINALIGCFYRREYSTIMTHYTRSFQEACYLFTQYEGSFVKKDMDMYSVMFEENFKSQETESPLYLQILDMEAVEVHKLSKIVGKVSRVKTDAVESENIVDISSYEWARGVPKYKYEALNDCKVEMMPRYLRESVYINGKSQWTIIKDKDDYKELAYDAVKLKSCNIDGRAGVGKSHLIGKIKEVFDEKGLKYICLAPTNKASRNIGGMTIHKWVGKNSQRIGKLKKVLKNIDRIIIDEVSMLHEIFYKLLINMKQVKPELGFIIVGDFGQLLPVNDRGVYDYENSRALYEICNGNRISLTKCKRSDDILFNICKDPENVKTGDFGNKLTMRNICFTNKRRIEVNEACMNKAVYRKKFINVPRYVYDKNSQDMKLCIGTPIISRANCCKYDICNNDTFEIVNITSESVELDEGQVIPISQFNRLFHVAYAITVHKSQGTTINEEYTIHEWDRMDTRLKYVALSRATCKENINIY